MIQFKKIPPSKSVILLLLFLTTNVCGFLRENQNEYEVSRKIQNRYSQDLQQSQNMPIRRVGIDRVITEKDGNAERLYDRRSFRTGTIAKTDNIQNMERSIERQQRSRVNVRTDVNNNREFSIKNLQIQNTRENRRSSEPTFTRENRQRQLNDRRSDERTVISRSRQYDERSLETRTERDLYRQVERSSDVRDRRNLRIRDLDRRTNQRRIDTETRFANTQNMRQEIVNERREVRDRQHQTRRTIDRELPQRQFNNRQIEERRSDRLAENRLSPDSASRSIRSVNIRDRRASAERNLNQRRSSTERFENMDARDQTDRRSAENRDRRVSELRSIDQSRSTSERSERMDFRKNSSERRSVENRDRRVLDLRNVDQRRSLSEERNINKIRSSTQRSERMDSRASPLERRSVENRDRMFSEIRKAHQRSSPNERSADQIQSSNERSERMNSREYLSERRSVDTRDRRISENRNINQRLLSSEERNVDQIRSSTERSERTNSRENHLQRRTVPNRDRRVADRSSIEQRLSSSTERLEFQNNRRLVDRADSRERLSRNSRHSVIRTAREDRTRDQPHREARELSTSLTRARQVTSVPVERRNQRLSGRNHRVSDIRTTIASGDRTIPSQRLHERRTSDVHIFREHRSFDNRQLSRSDSTRYIQDNISSRDVRLTHREASTRNTRENRRDVINKENSRRENIRITDRYNPVTADSRRYFEKIVSQRTTRNSVRNAETPVLGLETSINNNDAYTWVNTAKIILAAFLVGQIFVNSSKANRFRFYNVLSMATAIKEKVQ